MHLYSIQSGKKLKSYGPGNLLLMKVLSNGNRQFPLRRHKLNKTEYRYTWAKTSLHHNGDAENMINKTNWGDDIAQHIFTKEF